jgi:hypothetical protein
LELKFLFAALIESWPTFRPYQPVFVVELVLPLGAGRDAGVPKVGCQAFFPFQ